MTMLVRFVGDTPESEPVETGRGSRWWPGEVRVVDDAIGLALVAAHEGWEACRESDTSGALTADEAQALRALVSADGIRLLGGPTARPRLLIIGNSIAGQSCRIGASYTSSVAVAAGSGIKPGSNQITLTTGGVAALSLSPNDYIVVQTANQQPWPVQVTGISTETLTLAKRLPWTVRTVSGLNAGVSKVTPPVLFGGVWRQQFGIHNLANALAGGLFEVVPGYGHGSATADEIIAVLPQHLQFYRPAVVMLSLFENSIGSGTASELIAMADRAAGLCLAAGARPIVLHTLPTTAVGSSRADEYDDLRTAILNIAARVPGAIGIDPGSIYLDTSDGTNPRRPLSGWTDGVVHPLESKRATIALNGGLVAALQSCAQGQTVNIPALLQGANPTMAGTGGTGSTLGGTPVVAASTTIAVTGPGLTGTASKNADDSQRVGAEDAGSVTAGTETLTVAQTYSLPVSWGFRTRVKLMAEVTVHSQTNLASIRVSTSFGTQDVDMRTSSASSEPFDTTLVGRKVVLESMPVPVLDPSVTSATITLAFRTLTATGFAVDATVHSLGFAVASCGEVDDGAIALL